MGAILANGALSVEFYKEAVWGHFSIQYSPMTCLLP